MLCFVLNPILWVSDEYFAKDHFNYLHSTTADLL